MNNTPLQTCPKIVKWTFIFFNILFGILGILLIALGSWLVATGNSFLQATGATAPEVQGIILGGAALIILCGLITFVLAALGVLGGICQARPLLIIFAVGLILIVLIEFIAAIVAFVASGVQPTLITAVTDQLRAALTTYTIPASLPAVNAFVDGVQNTFDCCGINNTTQDWVNSMFFNDTNGSFPPSCCQGMPSNCTLASTEFRNQACIPAIQNLIVTNRLAAVVLGAIVLIILLVEFSGIGIAIGLCCCIRSAKLTLV